MENIKLYEAPLRKLGIYIFVTDNLIILAKCVASNY